MEEKYLEIQSILSKVIDTANQENNIYDLLNKSFMQLLSLSPGFLAAEESLLLIRDKNNLLAKTDFEKFSTTCSIDSTGNCLCSTLENSAKIISCNHQKNSSGDIEHSHLCIPFRRNNSTIAAYVFQISKTLNTEEAAFFELYKNLLESFVSNKLKENELQLKAKQQDVLNQKLFAQSIEIDQKNIEIQENEQKIKDQYEELLAVEEELRQNNEELQVLLENIEIQKEQLEHLNLALRKSNARIDNAHKEIVASINYAKTIQQALLTNTELINSYLPEYFILYEPKNQVGGDFFYINKIDNKIHIAVADCTGHGVAGAFLTILGITYLHEAVRQIETRNPADVLTDLREHFKRTFQTFGSKNTNGLDIALCELNSGTNNLLYAGANKPLWIIRNNEIIECKPTKNPVGYYPKEVPFELQEIKLQPGDNIYLFTDGYRDQYGGEKGKFKLSNFRQLLLSIQNLTMEAQKEKLVTVFKVWKGDNAQTDDVLILGFRV